MIEVIDAAGVTLTIFGVVSFFLCFGVLFESRIPWVTRLAFIGALLSILLGAAGAGFGVYAASMRSNECAMTEVSDD
jgi:hypothetical protein